MRLLTLTTATLLLTSCYAAGQKLITPSKAKAGSLPVVGRCAVIVRPDNKKIAWMKIEGSQDDYNASVNDNEYYVGTSIAFLDSAKVKQIYRQAHGVLVFKSWSGQYFKVSLADVYWGIFLFNGRTKPIEADVTDIGFSYRAYMKKKIK